MTIVFEFVLSACFKQKGLSGWGYYAKAFNQLLLIKWGYFDRLIEHWCEFFYVLFWGNFGGK